MVYWSRRRKILYTFLGVWALSALYFMNSLDSHYTRRNLVQTINIPERDSGDFAYEDQPVPQKIHDEHNNNYNDSSDQESPNEEIVINPSEEEMLKPVIVNPHEFKYIIENPKGCYDANYKIGLLIIVHSKVDNFVLRQAIRDSYAGVTTHNNIEIRTRFMLAMPENPDVQNLVHQESDKYHDIVQENFHEHYRNLTHKHMMGYKWALTYCKDPDFILKVDDDVLVNIFSLVEFIEMQEKVSEDLDFLYCSVYTNQGPRRDKADKWYVSEEEYSYPKYPDYCEGFAYVISRKLMTKLYKESLSTKYFWIDDVFMTGFLMSKLKLKHKRMHNPFGYAIMSTNLLLSKNNKKTMFVLAKYNASNNLDLWTKFWKNMVETNINIGGNTEKQNFIP